LHTVKGILDKSRPKIGKTFPLIIGIRHKGKCIDLPTGIASRAENFDENKQQLKSSKELQFQVKNRREKYPNL